MRNWNLFSRRHLKLHSFVLALILSASLSGCATESKYRARVESWRGKDAQELIHSWGEPETREKLANGNQVLLFIRLKHAPYSHGEVRRDVANAPVAQDSSASGTSLAKNSAFNIRCPTYFEVNPAGKIVSVEFRGEECLWRNER